MNQTQFETLKRFARKYEDKAESLAQHMLTARKNGTLLHETEVRMTAAANAYIEMAKDLREVIKGL